MRNDYLKGCLSVVRKKRKKERKEEEEEQKKNEGRTCFSLSLSLYPNYSSNTSLHM